MQVGEIMHTDVKTANADDTFADVAKTMRLHGISSVVILDGKKLAGILTERALETVSPKTDIAEAAEHMAARNIRHLPVVDRGRVVGIISIRDLTRWAAEELSGGHEMPDIARSTVALRAATELQKQRRKGAS